MQSSVDEVVEKEAQVHDLGPLAWVLEELRKSLDGATKAIRRFVRDAELARGSDLESLDSSQLRIARQQLHQAVGALEMVGLPEPAKLLRAMETLAQKFVERPESCSDDAVVKVERAGYALVEFLEAVLRGKQASAVSLFPQYRDIQGLIGEERSHPAELWSHAWHWIDADVPLQVDPKGYAAPVRAQLDSAVLRVIKTGSVSAAKTLRDVALGLAAAQTQMEPRAFWKICSGFFEALSLKLCPADVYSKRAASRLLMQYTSLAKGTGELSERLAQDLLFFCSLAAPGDEQDAPVLKAVREAYGLAQTRAVSYEIPQYGRFDPAVLVQARKRIATATETWSALSGGDTNRLKVVSDQFSQVGDSLLKLHPENKELSRSLMKAVDSTVKSGEPPSTPVAMEVATAILYLDAAYEDLDPAETNRRERSDRLARRLDHVLMGGEPESLEPWMEELYRRVSDRQTMGSVVEELRSGLTEIEKSLDTFFRNPKDKAPLNDVPNQLAQMRGVFSVLGLDQASLATVRMRDMVEKFLVDTVDESTAASGIFEKFGNSLGALGFLIDMLSYQRALAKKLFVFDEEAGEFKPLMGREREVVVVTPPAPPPSVAPVLSSTPTAAPLAMDLSATPTRTVAMPRVDAEEDDTDLREIFLEEAREVVQNGQAAIQALIEDPSNLADQTTLRRAFHTLKGSSRMVSFNEFGEAAWAMEQMMNTWLAEQKPVPAELLQVASSGLQGLDGWVTDIVQGQDASRSAAPFRASADAMRREGRYLPVAGEENVSLTAAAAAEEEAPVQDFSSTQMISFDLDESPNKRVEVSGEPLLDVGDLDFGSFGTSPAEPASAASSLDGLEVGDIDFSSLADVPPLAAPETPTADAVPVLDLDWDPTRLSGVNDVPAAEVPIAKLDWTSTQKIAGGATTDFELPELQSNWADTTTPSVDASAAPGDLAAESSIEGFDFDFSIPAAAEPAEEPVKVIGHLRIGIPLYNVFLNEADEWSRRLVTELNEWALELHHPVPDSAVALAHSLGGSSATVGFTALSEIARALEQTLQHVRLQGDGQAEQARVFIAAAENVRHLLHQFAAGFLKEPEPELMEALATINTIFDDLPSSAPLHAGLEVDEAPDIDFDDLNLDFTDTTVADEPAPAPSKAVPMAPHATGGVLPGAAQIVAADEDDDIDAVDALDPDLLPIFQEEATELMPQLGSSLRQWAETPDDHEARLDVLRVLHTLKGSARLAGAMRMGEMAHRMESAIEQMGSEYVQAAQIEPMLTRYDRIREAFDTLGQEPEQDVGLSLSPVEAPVAPAAPVSPSAAKPSPVVALPQSKPAMAAPAGNFAPPANLRVTPVAAAARGGHQTVRVRSNLLDRLVNQAGEVMITRSRIDARLNQLTGSLTELTSNLDRLRTHLRDVELQAETQMQSRLAQAKDTAQGFDPLEFDRFTRVQELTRMMAESVNDVATVQRNLQQAISSTEDDLIAQGRQTRELQRDLLRTRMQEFEGISERLYGVVRQASKDAGKQVRLDIRGGNMEIDRGVLDRMAPAFEHILRNSVAHGVEDAKRREAAGKQPAGTITIGLTQEGNDVSITFSDDGAGLNLPRIREKALAQGLIPPGQDISDAEAANLIFMPGFSTATSVTELAGRGIGMDVVRAEVQSLGGRIETTTTAGQGTSFKLVLPLTTAVTQVLMLRTGDLSLGVPSNLVEIVRRVNQADLDQAYAQGSIAYGEEQVPLFWAGALLQSSARSHETAAKTLPVVVLRSAGQRVAVHVDEVLGNQEVVVKNLGPQLSRLPGLAGMSVLASGAVVLIYNPVALAAVYGQQAWELQRGETELAAQAVPQAGAGQASETAMPPTSRSANELPLVLVVDDSITVRRVTQRLLRREGYRVTLAADGLQALERLAEEKPDVVLSDIEMPRMDGFDLVRNIRADAQLRDLPVIMITSRIAQKHRDLAEQLGVSNYLGKPYSEEELLALIKHYCSGAVAA